MEAILSGIFGLVGVAVGFLLSEWKKREEDKKNRENVRSMLHYEIEQNLRVLKEAKSELELFEAILITENHKKDGDIVLSFEERMAQENQVKSRLAQELNDYPFPEWRQTVWAGQMSLVADALNHGEIDSVLKFYSELDRITEIRTLIKHNAQEKVARDSINYDPRVQRLHRDSDYSVYFGRNVDLWHRFDQAVKRLREIGNPLAK